MEVPGYILWGHPGIILWGYSGGYILRGYQGIYILRGYPGIYILRGYPGAYPSVSKQPCLVPINRVPQNIPGIPYQAHTVVSFYFTTGLKGTVRFLHFDCCLLNFLTAYICAIIPAVLVALLFL